MDYVLVILVGILTVGYMIRDHISFVNPDVGIQSEEDIEWRNHPGEW